jgi:ankyrin repeat protein
VFRVFRPKLACWCLGLNTLVSVVLSNVQYQPTLSLSHHLSPLQVLLKAGARVDAANDRGRTALMSVSYAGLDKIAKTLLEMGADPNIQDGDGWSAVRWAAKGNQGRTVHLLCRWGGDPNSKDFEGWHTLMAASLEGHRDVVKALIEEGADVNSSDKEGNTPLMTAAYGGNLDTVRDLIRSGASISALDKQGRSAADWAREGLAENQGGKKSRRDDFSSILDLVSAGRTGPRSGARGLRRPSHI